MIASRVGALSEVVVDGSTGLTFNPKDTEALAAALEKLSGDDAMRMRMGRAGKDRICAEFSVGKMLEKFLTLYYSMIFHSQ